jgi:ankyrin repeat protein
MLPFRPHFALPLVLVSALVPALSQARDVGEFLPDSVGRLGVRQPLMSPAVRVIAAPISGPGVPALNPDHFALIEAIAVRDRKTVQTLARRAGVPNRLPDGRSPLVLSVDAGDVELVRTLLDAGAQPNVKDGFGRTPLGLAALGGHHRIVVVLLARGARPDVKEDNGAVPLHHAASLGFDAIAGALLDAGADVEVRDRPGHTPLINAIRNGRASTVKLLLDRGADPELAGKDKLSPLYWAVYRRHRAIADALVAAGAPLGAVSLDALE